MDFQQWNSALGEWFLRESEGHPVYLSATASELQHMNDAMSLGMDDVVAELSHLVTLYRYSNFHEKHETWYQSRSMDIPPWLPFLAASVLVVDEQTDIGSTRFYDPLSKFMGTPRRISQTSYDASFATWWRSMSRWLREVHRGELGFSTWDGIPVSGARSSIGHPYTQVLLRRQERIYVDAFLAEFGQIDEEQPAVSDRNAVAEHLVDAFRRWSAARHSVGGRLRTILNKPDGEASHALGYLLLGRLFDPSTDSQVQRAPERSVVLTPAFNDYRRWLQIVAVTPQWVSASDSLDIGSVVLTEPGELVPVDLDSSDQLLRYGNTPTDGFPAQLAGREMYTLVKREWSEWCGVDGVFPEEEVLILARADFATRHGLSASKSAAGLPESWIISGPDNASALPASIVKAVVHTSRRLIPRLRGGLKLEPGVYLVGGEPVLEVPGSDVSVRINGVNFVVDGEIKLSSVGLKAGQHTVESKGFDFTFTTLIAARLPDPKRVLGRSPSGIVEVFKPGDPFITGAIVHPEPLQEFGIKLIPPVERFWQLGTPGVINETEGPGVAAWASESGLPHVAVEPNARSTYPAGRKVLRTVWVAWQNGSGDWAVAHFNNPPVDFPRIEPINWVAARGLVGAIGQTPEVRLMGNQTSLEDVIRCWNEYCIAVEASHE